VTGYQQLLIVLADLSHEEHAEMRAWAGDDFDPEAFDVDEANLRMPHARRRRARPAGGRA
jgi:hypothetical protein